MENVLNADMIAIIHMEILQKIAHHLNKIGLNVIFWYRYLDICICKYNIYRLEAWCSKWNLKNVADEMRLVIVDAKCWLVNNKGHPA